MEFVLIKHAHADTTLTHQKGNTKGEFPLKATSMFFMIAVSMIATCNSICSIEKKAGLNFIGISLV